MSGLFGRKRTGLSDLVATVLLIAMTLIAGAALFGYINGQAASSENKLGAANAANVNFLNERFVIPQLTFKYTAPTNQISVYLYNDGQLTDSFVEIEVYTLPRNGATMDLLYYFCSPATSQTTTICQLPQPPKTQLSGNRVLDLNNNALDSCYADAATLESPTLQNLQVPVGGISAITLTLPSFSAPCVNGAFSPGNIYYVQVLGQFGNTLTYFQAM